MSVYQLENVDFKQSLEFTLKLFRCTDCGRYFAVEYSTPQASCPNCGWRKTREDAATIYRMITRERQYKAHITKLKNRKPRYITFDEAVAVERVDRKLSRAR